MYQRNASNSISQGQGHQLSAFIGEAEEDEYNNEAEESEDDIFDIDDGIFYVLIYL
jgi:hypothetical protein